MNSNLHPTLPILIVDDEQDALQSYKSLLKFNGYNNLILCQDSRKAMSLINTNGISVIILDLNMPGVTGNELLESINEKFPEIPVIIISAVEKIEIAVQCMRHGAFDYMTKPVEKSHLFFSINRALEVYELKAELLSLRQRVLSRKLQNPDAFSDIISNNEKIKAIFRYIEAVCGSSKPILITGESGVGKEMFARSVYKAKQYSGEFVPVNVAGLDENMFADSLFGHMRGAFTGADSQRPGLVKQAENGILFLDEIGDLDFKSQVKLLRLLQEREYTPLGSDIVKSTNTQIIAATNVNLEEKVEQNLFRRDLYYRLATHHIHIPPLRERSDDLPLLIEYFINEASRFLNKKVAHTPPELKLLLSNYSFPGNIRELQSMIFDAVARHENGIFSLQYFREYIENKTGKRAAEIKENTEGSPVMFGERFPSLKEVEEFLIKEAMERADGNQTIASQLLGISQSTLSRRFKPKE